MTKMILVLIGIMLSFSSFSFVSETIETRFNCVIVKGACYGAGLDRNCYKNVRFSSRGYIHFEFQPQSSEGFNKPHLAKMVKGEDEFEMSEHSVDASWNTRQHFVKLKLLDGNTFK